MAHNCTDRFRSGAMGPASRAHRQEPPAQDDPLGLGLHLPFLRFLHAGHAFFFAAASCKEEAPRSRLSAPPRAEINARRREPAAARDRVTESKRSLSMGDL